MENQNKEIMWSRERALTRKHKRRSFELRYLCLIRAFHPCAAEDGFHAQWGRPQIHLFDTEWKRGTLASSTNATSSPCTSCSSIISHALTLRHCGHVLIELRRAARGTV